MAFTDWCPLDDDGNIQRCPVWVDVSATTDETTVTLPGPAYGEVVAYQFPIAIDAAENSSEECP